MSKITIIHFVPGDHIALTPHAIMKHLDAQAIHDFGTNANPSPALVRQVIRIARRSKHVAVLAVGDTNVRETMERLIKRDDLAIEVHHTSYSLIAGQIVHITSLGKTVEERAAEFSAAIVDGMAPGEAIRKAMTERPEWALTGRRKDTGEKVEFPGSNIQMVSIDGAKTLDRFPGQPDKWATPQLEGRRYTTAVIVHGPQGCGKTRNARTLAEKLDCDVIQDGSRLDVVNGRWFPPRRSLFLVNSGVDELVERLKRNAVSRGENPEKLRIELYQYHDIIPEVKSYRFPMAPVDFEVPHKKAHVRGVANGATMYAMGLVEGMAVGDRYITLIVNGDEDVKKIFIDYPFINWDSGRIQVRTVSEVLMVSAEDKAALGYAEWVADVTPENLNALLELNQWTHFVAFLSGDKFDRFTKDYSQ